MFDTNLPRIEIGENFWRDINVLETVIDVLGMRLSDFREPLRFALEYVILPSVETNFARGGRPTWQPLAASTVGRRGGQLGPILYRTGKLYNAATDASNWTITQNLLTLASITDKVPYAGYHQFGAPGANIPARPYVEFQPQDIEDITSLFESWVSGIVDEVWGFGGEGPG